MVLLGLQVENKKKKKAINWANRVEHILAAVARYPNIREIARDP